MSAIAFAGGGVTSTAAIATAAQDEGGPPNPDQWSIALEETFDGGGLDESIWSLGWGWGTSSTTSDAPVIPENVNVQDGVLRLQGTHDGNDAFTGGVNTLGTVEFGPGSYIEAKLQFPDRVGFHPAFWAQPITFEWPPEFDVVEILQSGDGQDDTHTSRHFVHYSESTEPGDEATHTRARQFYEPGDDLTANFHVYGAEWRTDRISYYVDGEEILRLTDSTILESFRNGAPFYLLLTLSINIDSELNEYLGQVDLSESWGETFDSEWVRLWQQ